MLRSPRSLRCALVRWRAHAGDPLLTLVCKATYRLEPQRAVRASLAEAIATGDLAPFKPASDVVVVGQARPGAQRGRFSVGDVDKVVDLANGAACLAGIGPLAADSEQRRFHLGRHATSWREDDLAFEGFPHDASPRYWNVAPPDQQMARPLREDERVVLEQLSASHSSLTTRLPGDRPIAFVARSAAAPFAVPLLADTIWIDAGRDLCTLTWRAQLAAVTDLVAIYAATAEAGRELSFDDVCRLAADGFAEPIDEPSEVTLTAMSTAEAVALPFQFAAEIGTRPGHALAELGPRRDTGTMSDEQLYQADDHDTAPPPPAPRPLVRPPDPVRDLQLLAPVAAAAPQPAPLATEPQRTSEVATPAQVYDLLWHDRSQFSLLEGQLLQQQERIDDDWISTPPAPESDALTRERRLVAELIRSSRPCDLGAAFTELRKRLASGPLRPLACVDGELVLVPDPREALATTVAIASSLAGNDKALREPLERARQALAIPSLPAELADAARIQLLDACQHGPPLVRNAEPAIERALVVARALAVVDLFGRRHARVYWRIGEQRTVAYLPKTAARELPLCPHFAARAIVELRPPQEYQEPSPIALRILAIAATLSAAPDSPKLRRSRSAS